MKRVINKIVRIVKQKLYFFVASYFAFFARIYLKRWSPKIITVTGSSGKTTLLHLFEAQLGDRAHYSHHANSTFGIPFHVLGLERKSYSFVEWFVFAIQAPFRAFRRVRPERLYVTEADAERPREGRFLAQLLRPDILVWLSLEEAHGVQYDRLSKTSVSDKSDPLKEIENVKSVIAEEFGWFLKCTRSLAVLNQNNKYIVREAEKTAAKIIWLDSNDFTIDKIQNDGITFITKDGVLSSPHLLPPDAGLSLLAVTQVLRHLNIGIDLEFKRLVLPPSRSSVLHGVSHTTLIDSSYNGTMDGMRNMLGLFAKYPAKGEKWIVLGDMVEQGKSEAYEHTSLAPLILAVQPSRVVLVGPRLAKHTKPLVNNVLGAGKVAAYDLPNDAYNYLAQEIRGNETILFKGARYLEGVVEKLLLDRSDAVKLCRRESIWEKKRKAWGI